MTRTLFLGWSAFVGISWVLLAAAFVPDETCSFICPTFSELLTILFLPAAFVWALGLFVMYIAGRLRRGGSSSDTEADRCGT